MDRFDALIIGGGPAGGVAAILLARAGWSVLLVEKATFPRQKVCGEYLSPTNFGLMKHLGLLDALLARAGPEVRRIELLWRTSSIVAAMPAPPDSMMRWGRALRREILDTQLLAKAQNLGVVVRQPFSVVKSKRVPGGFASVAESKRTGDILNIHSRVVVAAHGSWGVGELPTQQKHPPQKASDLLAFKVYLKDANLPRDLMNMLVVPGGYAGMVNCDDGLVSTSCCIRRDYVETLRRESPSQKAGSVVFQHLVRSCKQLEPVVRDAYAAKDWLAAGPIRPGIRKAYNNGFFLIGNAAGEAHPTIADGISMAMQSAWLLSTKLTKLQPDLLTDQALEQIGTEYKKEWLRTFRLRIRAAEAFAKMCIIKKTHKFLLPIISTFPQTLTLGARLGGIVHEVVD